MSSCQDLPGRVTELENRVNRLTARVRSLEEDTERLRTRIDRWRAAAKTVRHVLDIAGPVTALPHTVALLDGLDPEGATP